MVMMTVLLGLLASGQTPTAGKDALQVVFVCEHGAAKSLIAAAYFNKLATERGLPVRAAFRGLSPQEDLSNRAVAGLRADGLAVPNEKPAPVLPPDVTRATHIVAIGSTLPPEVVASGKTSSWSDVPDDQGYPAMRDAILAHVRELLGEIERAR